MVKRDFFLGFSGVVQRNGRAVAGPVYRILGVFQPVSSMIHIYMRASEEFCVCLQPERRAGFIVFFLSLVLGVVERNKNNVTSSFTSRAWDFDVTWGMHLGRRHFHFLFSVYQSRVGVGMAGTTNKTPFYTTSSVFGFHGVAFSGSESRQASHHRLPKASMYVNLADDMHSRPKPGAALRIQYTTVLVHISILPFFSITYLPTSPRHAIWPLPKTMMGIL